jgi:hypothetical protein
MPDAVEHADMNHPDFRVGKKIFATLGYPDAKSGMVKLNSEQQRFLVSAKPKIFAPAHRGWGRNGSTLTDLEAIDETTAASAVQMAWENIAT